MIGKLGYCNTRHWRHKEPMHQHMMLPVALPTWQKKHNHSPNVFAHHWIGANSFKPQNVTPGAHFKIFKRRRKKDKLSEDTLAKSLQAQSELSCLYHLLQERAKSISPPAVRCQCTVQLCRSFRKQACNPHCCTKTCMQVHSPNILAWLEWSLKNTQNKPQRQKTWPDWPSSSTHMC